MHGYPVKVGDRVWNFKRLCWLEVIDDNKDGTKDQISKRLIQFYVETLFWQPIDPSAIEAAKVKKEPEYDYYWYCARIDMMTSRRYTKEFLFACFDNASEFSCIKESKREVKS